TGVTGTHTLDTLRSGAYSILLTDKDNSCQTTGSITIDDNPKVPYAENADVVLEDQDICAPDGSVLVEAIYVNGVQEDVTLVNYDFDWYVGEADLTAGITTGDRDSLFNSSDYASIGSGTYYFEAERRTGNREAGEGCVTAPFRVDLEDISIDPVMLLSQLANLACDQSFATGELTLSATTDGLLATDYYYTISSAMYADIDDSTGVTGTHTLDTLRSGAYSVLLTDKDNSCQTTGSITIDDNPKVPYAENADVVLDDQDICAPDGSVLVEAIYVNGVQEDVTLVNYDFDWYVGEADLTAGITTGDRDSLFNSSDYANIGGGTYYFEAERRTGNREAGEGCVMAPYRVDLGDLSVDPMITYTTQSNQSCDTSFVATGEITLAITAGTATNNVFDIIWNNYPTSSPGDIINGGLAAAYDSLTYGEYQVIVRDTASKCTRLENITVNDNPLIPSLEDADYLVDPQSVCFNEGSITIVSINPGDTSEYDFAWYEGDDNLNTGTTIPGLFDSYIDTTNYAGIQAGTYYFAASKVAGAIGYRCNSAPYKASIPDEHIDPTLILNQIANRACDLAFTNGEVSLTALTSGVPASDYEYTITLAGPVDNGFTGATGIYTYSNAQPGTYVVLIRDVDSECTTEGTITVEDSPAVPYAENLDISVADQDVCFNDGSITVNAIYINNVVEPIANFTFSWYVGQQALNDSTVLGPVDAFLDTSNYSNIAAGDYYFKIQRSAGTPTDGEGCVSNSYRIDIEDVSIDPTITYVKSANQNCDLSFANGSILVNALTGGAAIPPYSYTLSSTVLAADIDSLNNDFQVDFTDLQPGTYNVRVVEDSSQCFSNSEITIEDIPVIANVEDLLMTIIDQSLCSPDGSVVIDTINLNGVSQPLSDYDFTWYASEADLNADNPIAGAINAFLDTSNYASIGEGEYYFRFKRNSSTTAAGEGCETAPIRANIQDISTNPYVAFNVVYNTSCELTQPNGELSAFAEEKNPSLSDDYSFVWSLNGGAIPGTVIQTDSDTSSVLTDAPDGDYTVIVTNISRTSCIANSGFTVKKDTLDSEPNLILVDITDPLYCFPTGRMLVTELKVGGATGNINDYDYLWYKDTYDNSGIINDSGGNPVLTSNLDNQYPGTYYLVARNLYTLCEANPKELIISDDSITYPDIRIVQDEPQSSCDPLQPNGILTATADNGNDDTNLRYLFNWFIGNDTTTAVIASTSTVGGLEDDEHTVSVYDTLTGCISTDYYFVEDGVEKYRPRISAASTPQFSCITDDGSVSATVLNVTGNFRFDWYINNTVVFSGSPYEPVSPGIYTVTATDLDKTFCTSNPVKIEVTDRRSNPAIVIHEDNPMTFCWDDAPNGQLSANIGGKIGGYTFEWFNGPDPTGTPFETLHLILGQSAGTYTLQVTDNNTGCASDTTVTLSDSTLTPPSATIEILSHQTSCVDPPKGLLTAYVAEGDDRDITDYHFDWYDGATVSASYDFRGVKYRDLYTGEYTVTAQDMITGCISEPATEEILDERKFPKLKFNIVPAKCERSDGQIEVEVTNVLPIERILWYDDFGSEIEQGIGLYGYPTGVYEISVTTFEGCVTDTVTEIGVDINEFNGISANGDGLNDYFEIACITLFPDNNVKIFNRVGVLVYEVDGYNNADLSFLGYGENGIYLIGEELPAGTYFYIIDKRDGSDPVAGYLELNR
ncbi:gliding motility-associated C-terminal domain-containing protein, partial [Bacteroidota bacterium]